jgi:hypothetical protein
VAKPTLNYEPRSRRKRGLSWILIFAGFSYAFGALLCWGRTSDEMFNIMSLVTVVVIAVATIAVGIRYGTQDKEFWT